MTSSPASPSAPTIDGRPTIRRRWTVSLLLVIVGGALLLMIFTRAVNEHGARLTGRAWLANSSQNTLPVLVLETRAALEHLARERADRALFADAITLGDGAALAILFSGGSDPERWGALHPDGSPIADVAPRCPPEAIARALASPGHAVSAVCGVLPALVVAVRAGAGWLVAERDLGAWFAKALSQGAGPEIALVGPGGHLVGSASDLDGRPATVVLGADLRAHVAPGADPYYGVATVHVPAYGGYKPAGAPGEAIGRGDSELECDVALAPIPGMESSPVRVLFWVPADMMRIGARYATLFLGIGTLVVALIAFAVSARLTRTLTRPLGALADAADRVSRGDLSADVPIDGDRETARLGANFAAMLASLRETTGRLATRNDELQAANEGLRAADELVSAAFARQVEAMERVEVTHGQLVQAGKLAAVGTLVAGLSHELNNPIAVIVGYVQGLLRTTPAGSPAHVGLSAIERQAQRCAALVKSLLDFSRQRPPEREEVEVGRLVDRVVELAAAQAKHRGVALQRSAQPADLPRLNVAAEDVSSALLNLVSNALDATPAGGRVVLAVLEAAHDERPGLALTVQDNGTGIPPDVLPHVFDPFFTTKPPGRGTGLGLPLSRQIVEWHGGSLQVETEVGRGTTMRIWLPLDGQALITRIAA
ncbi:MAG TPA: HAMP domain-containing sensor histidine kinase [Myxococcota bacterium]|nr:HAMP domain-containing sensor histidine kinase [Myxococcota bacterium]